MAQNRKDEKTPVASPSSPHGQQKETEIERGIRLRLTAKKSVDWRRAARKELLDEMNKS